MGRKRKPSEIEETPSLASSSNPNAPAVQPVFADASTVAQPQARAKTDYLSFTGARNFRERILFSLLSGKAIRIDDIRVMRRSESDGPLGLRDYEVSFLRLIDRLTNGTECRINDTGTALKFKPGLLIGNPSPLPIQHQHPTPNASGSGLDHRQCRAIGYFIEPLLLLASFCRNPTNIEFIGATNGELDPSVCSWLTL